MFHIHFFVGLGVGAFIATFFLWVFLIALVGFWKRQSKEQEAANTETLRLMKERNELDERKAAALEKFAELYGDPTHKN